MDPTARPSVLFVSKPITAPFADGSKCLVRDLCLHLPQVSPHVMSTQAGAPELGPHATIHAVYRDAGGFAPGLIQNLRASLWLARAPRFDIWHSVFAPNPRASQSLRLIARARGARVCQTIASPPRNFERPERLLFGDVVVAQSAWTKQKFLDAYQERGTIPPPLLEIPPPCPLVESPSVERMSGLRHGLGVDEGAPLFLYPGDLEVSGAAEWLLGWASELCARVPDARLVIAYRTKTERTSALAEKLSRKANPHQVIFVENCSDIVALLATSRAVLFPVDDLYGKVDLPLVLLEALSLGTAVLALNDGPLRELRGASRLPLEVGEWLEAISALGSFAHRTELGRQAQREVQLHYAPEVVSRAYGEVYRSLLADKPSGR